MIQYDVDYLRDADAQNVSGSSISFQLMHSPDLLNAASLLSALMPRLRPTSLLHMRTGSSIPRHVFRRTRLHSRRTLTIRKPPPPPFPVVQSCPDPTCPCSSMPELDQEIDHEKTLNGTMSAHSQHLIISTGQNDWRSRIEDERENGTSWGSVVGDLKALLGRSGELHNAFNATMISTSSFLPTSQQSKKKRKRINGEREWGEQETVDALLFPAFRHYRGLLPLADSHEEEHSAASPHTESQPLTDQTTSSSGTIKDFIVQNLTPNPGESKVNIPTTRSDWASSPITNPTMLICSHAQRDSRCGILGPVLHAEFNKYLDQRKGDDPDSNIRASNAEEFMSSGDDPGGLLEPQHSDSRAQELGQAIDESTLESMSTSSTQIEKADASANDVVVNIGMISHIGGHKWAGNVIIYFPPGFSTSNATKEALLDDSQRASGVQPLHPLAGMSIWYGRVEPKHVEGIIEQTVVKGKVIEDLFRGGLDQKGHVLRI
ncbi:hypothetical protein H2200_010906 [Cladophialophora chaetospira]|uniref:Altered inheritance of mitochondria protein 32 n=1 Tax=Cladophialophora chaetospira TaxID=386627 RepID=A0AA39CDZ1_9EURO|nr:hypothetical protein H2200_010906 [Cladophialophora chaetospira]